MGDNNFSLRNYKVLSIIAFSLLLLVPQQPFVFASHNEQLVVQTGDTIDGKTLDGVGNPLINDSGDIVFFGTFFGGDGIFTPTSLVAGTGDTIDGKTLTGAGNQLINDSGDIVFEGSFSGGNGIFTHNQGLQCGTGTTLNTSTNECEADPQPSQCAAGTTLNESTNECDADVTQSDLDALQSQLDNLFANNLCSPLAETIPNVLVCITDLVDRVAELEALVGEKDTLTLDECEDIRNTIEDKIADGKKISPKLQGDADLCDELYP